MADKYTDDKLYKVVRKDGSHLNTTNNPPDHHGWEGFVRL